MVIYLERGADLHMAQLMPLPLAVSCFSKIQIGFTFLVPAHLGSPRKWAVKRVCVCALNERKSQRQTAIIIVAVKVTQGHCRLIDHVYDFLLIFRFRDIDIIYKILRGDIHVAYK